MNASFDRAPAGTPLAGGMADLPEIPVVIGLCLEAAPICAMVAVPGATAEDPEEYAALAAAFLDCRRKSLDAMVQKRRVGAFLPDIPEIAASRRLLNAFYATLTAMSEMDLTISRTVAEELAARARRDVIPAIGDIMAHLGSLENAAAAGQTERVREEAAIIVGMLSERRRIGRMIGLISLTAGVVAMRAGGEPGRSFQVIAQEVRSLARQSSDVLERMTRRISETAGDTGARIKRHFRSPSARLA